LENRGGDITPRSFRKKKRGIWLEIYQDKELWGRLNLEEVDLEGELFNGGGKLTYFWNPLDSPEYRQVERDTFTVSAFIDSDKNIRESNEKNNLKQTDARCKEFMGNIPCDIRLNSVSHRVNSGSEQIIVLNGKFGPEQGERFICCKRPRNRRRKQSLLRIKILSWTDTEIVVQFPAVFSETVQVGIFCSKYSPYHSGWKTIRIRNLKGTGYKRSEAKKSL
jgi:hypothetical protein